MVKQAPEKLNHSGF